MPRWEAPKIWKDGECWIIGGGPSITKQFDIPAEIVNMVASGEKDPDAYSPFLQPIHDKHVIGINNAYQLGNWIDISFFGDCGWYLVYQEPLVKHPSLTITCCPRFANKPEKECRGIKFLNKDSQHRQGITSNPQKVSWNGNSGAASISLARHLGVKRIILLGFDMNTGSQGRNWWHSGHNDKTPPFARHLRGFPAIAQDAERMGLEIINANPDSSITSFPMVPAKELF